MSVIAAAIFNAMGVKYEGNRAFRSADFLPLFILEPTKDRKQDVNKLLKSFFGVPDNAGKS